MGLNGLSVSEAYLEGRLLGLSQLVTVLREFVESGEPASPGLVKNLVGHLSRETDSIVNDLREQHGGHPVFVEVERKSNAVRQAAVKVAKAAEAALPELIEREGGGESAAGEGKESAGGGESESAGGAGLGGLSGGEVEEGFKEGVEASDDLMKTLIELKRKGVG